MADLLFDAVERARLCDLFDELGPEAPALLEPWTATRDLAAPGLGRGPRTNEPAMAEALWRNVRRAPWFLARRRRGAGLELQWTGTARTVRARRGEPTACIAGPPGELLLYLFGRQGAVQVEVSGPAEAVEAVRRAPLGM